MSSASRGPGRPPGYDSDTLDRIARVKSYERDGMSIAEIATLEQCSASYIKLLKRAPLDQNQAARLRKPPALKLTERAVAHHAVLAMRRDTRLRAFEPGKKLFWLDCVMEVHALGDGDGLAFGGDGDPFETHWDFAIALGGKPDDLEHFLRRGLLTRLPDSRIDLPAGIGLKPKERPRIVLPGSGEQRLAQPFGSGRGDENEDSENPPISLSDRIVKTPQFHYPEDSEIPRVSLSGDGLAYAAAAAAKDEENQPSSSSSSFGSRAGGGDSEIRQFHCPPDSAIPDSDINPQQSGLVEAPDIAEIGLTALTAELTALAKFPRAANADDLLTVQTFLKEGFTPDEVRLEIASKLKERNEVPPRTMRYFFPSLRQARETAGKLTAATRSIPPPSKLVEAPEPPEEPIVGTDIHAQFARVRRALKRTIPRTDFDMFAGKAQLAGAIDDGEITLALPGAFLRDTVRSRWGDRFSTLWRDENPNIRRVNFEVAAPDPPQAAD
jgi:hypothetical protein